jgi:hypothetical protein
VLHTRVPQGYENSWMNSGAAAWTNLPSASQLYQWYCAIYFMIVTVRHAHGRTHTHTVMYARLCTCMACGLHALGGTTQPFTTDLSFVTLERWRVCCS